MTATQLPQPEIREARPGDHQTIIAVLAEAFLHGDLAPWLVEPVEDRERIYPQYFALCMERAFQHATIEVTDDLSAVAIWYVHDGRVIPETPDYDERLAQITGTYHPQFLALDDAVTTQHPNGPDHHYLAWIVVHPSRQGSGHGTQLLEHHHAQLDADLIPAYLEATGRRNINLYRRHGYTELFAYDVADGGPHLFPMWRDPEPSPPSAVPGPP